MVHPLSHQIPRVRCYSGFCRLQSHFAYRTLTFFGLSSHTVLLCFLLAYTVLTPFELLHMVWPLPISLAATLGISFDFFSSAYLDVSVQRVPFVYLCVQHTMTQYCYAGLPHSDICESIPICGSSQLFAACRVLLRLLMPWHSPCALISLTLKRFSSRIFCSVFFFFLASYLL